MNFISKEDRAERERCADSGHNNSGGMLGDTCRPCAVLREHDLRTELTAKDEKIATLTLALAESHARIDAAIVTALRYESRHDKDPERGMLWGEHKMALMVDAALTTPAPPQGE